MRAKHHKLRPSKFHIKCETEKCPNFYNAQYAEINGLCKPCSRRKKWQKKIIT